MQTQRIPIRPNSPSIYLDTYLLHNSSEFQINRPRPAVLVCPGGGYRGTSDREAEPIALRFLAHGYHAFVLRYSVETRMPAALLDLAKAIATIRDNAAAWFVDPDQITVVGFSAGGHLAASLGVFWNEPFIYEALGVRPEQVKPNALVLGYAVIELEILSNYPTRPDAAGQPVYDERDTLALLLGERAPSQAARDQWRLDLHVSATSAPAFIWHTAVDQVVPVQHALRFAAALAEHQVAFELHIFESGIHGLALANEVTEANGKFVNPHSQTWVDLALNWLKLQREKSAA